MADEQADGEAIFGEPPTTNDLKGLAPDGVTPLTGKLDGHMKTTRLDDEPPLQREGEGDKPIEEVEAEQRRNHH